MADKENMMITTTLASLPVDIRTDIFSRLDAKTLARFRCVSKPLSSFVSTPDLIAAHRLRSRQNPHLLLFFFIEDGSVSLCSVDINTKDVIQVIEEYPFHVAEFLVQTCLELVCIHSWRANEIHIFNPTKNHSLSLPPLDLSNLSSRFSSPNYFKMCDVAFGYVASTNEYKVLCITTIYNRAARDQHVTCVANIFTLGTDKCWRDAQVVPPRLLPGSPTLVNETIHWLSAETSTISRFGLVKEEWSTLTDLPFMRETNSHLTELKGHLCYVDTGYDTKYIDIWMLQNYDNNSWSKEYHIDKSSLIDLGTDRALTNARVLTIDKDGRLLMYLPSPEGKLVYYDTSSGNIEDFHIREKLGLEDDDCMRAPIFYLDSFMPPDDQF